MSEDHGPEDAALYALWRAHKLDRAPASLPIDATITARTLGFDASMVTGETLAAPQGPGPASGAPRPGEQPAAAVEIETLPFISLAIGAGAAIEAAVVTSEGADLEAREVLGEGGMGRVLLARQRSLGREVAVKVIKPEARSAAVVDALVSEAVLTGALEHPNIIPVHALGRDRAGQPLLVMKRIEGVSWRAVLEDRAHPAWARLIERSGDPLVASIDVLTSVCNAVHFAHSRGVIHRDIKPENVMLGAFGEVYLVDWGIAVRPSNAGSRGLVGTPSFMAPEMLEGDPSRLDARTDVYLLGATLHQVLTGRSRHEGRTLYEAILHAHESAPYAYGPEVAPELAALANDACAREPSRRPESAEAFRHRLAEWLRHRGSIELARATRERAAGLADERDRTAFDRLATECRFAYVEALRQWADNQVATEGLRDCLSAMCRVELAAGNVAGARSLLDELAVRGAGDEALEARYRSALEKLRASEHEAERGRVALREMDERVGYRERLIVMGVMGTIAVGIMGYIVLRGGFAAMSVAAAARYSVVVLAIMSAVTLVFRRNLLANEFNRRVVSVVAICTVAMAVHRWVALLRGEQNLALVLADDLAMITAITTLAGVTVQRWFFAVAAVFAASSAMTYLWPARAHIVFSIGPIGAVITAALLQRKGIGTDRPGASR